MTAQLMSTPTEPYGAGAGRRVDAGQQVGPGGREVEHLDLVDLARIQSCLDRLVGPQAELRVPQRAVGVGMPGVVSVGKSPNTLSRSPPLRSALISAVLPQTGVLGTVAVEDQVLEPLGLRVVGAGLAVDEPEQTLTGGAEEVVTTVVRRVVERGHVRRALEYRGKAAGRRRC